MPVLVRSMTKDKKKLQWVKKYAIVIFVAALAR